MTTIYKYELEVEDQQILVIPKKSYFLDIIVQENPFKGKVDNIVFYYVVDTDELQPTQELKIRIQGTGNPFPQWNWDFVQNNLLHLKTVQHGPFVWHIFEDITDVVL